MPDLLFLTQRIPYPPNKGEKIRSYQVLRHLAQRYDVHLGCLIDDPADAPHVPTVEAMCKSAHIAAIDRRRAKVTCLSGLLTGEALSVTFYRDRGLQRWVRETLERVRPEAIVISSSNMAPYVLGAQAAVRLCDLVDVDSEKWRAYAEADSGPMRLVHRREWRKVASLEARIAREFDWSVFVSEQEAALFQRVVPGAEARVRAIPNGVDFDYFDPAIAQAALYATDRPRFVFTGTMDYPPNVDAVRWFVAEILPLIRATAPAAEFHIVGASPAPSVQALAGAGVFVTGRVPDVRPYVAHATAAVAPMRIARGIQNKVLEAMAMARPVVVTSDALEGIEATPGAEVLLADDAASFAARCLDAAGPLAAGLGAAARRRVERDYSWEGRLLGLDRLLSGQ